MSRPTTERDRARMREYNRTHREKLAVWFQRKKQDPAWYEAHLAANRERKRKAREQREQRRADYHRKKIEDPVGYKLLMLRQKPHTKKAQAKAAEERRRVRQAALDEVLDRVSKAGLSEEGNLYKGKKT